jgi:protein-S-isoprenylcysteine O-methyltransferase Ste14
MLGNTGFYRLGFNLFAVISFLPILYLINALPDRSAYEIPFPWSFLMYAGQGVSAVLLLAAFLQTDPMSFIGLRQLFEKDNPSGLVTHGLYRIVRHPLYLFGLLFIWLSPAASQNSLTVCIGATLYTMIGAYFEERKLLQAFGDAYARYKQNTPMLVPGLRIVRK